MREMGANAIRTSHNPPAPELLDLADEMGLLVIDEAFDMWGRTKVPNGHGKYFAEWGERDLRDMLRRDRNHPSVILWSIGNEILEQDEPAGADVARRLKAICREEDPTRLVTAGLNQLDNALRNGIAAAVDVVGFNYQARHYERILREHPDWIIYAAESASTVSSRGVYHLPIEKYKKHPSRQITSYDVIAPSWAYAPDPEFAAQDALPQVIGEFVWTGFDYLGEPTPYYGWLEPPDANDWPSRSSYFGIVDLAGFPKDRYFLYQSVWTTAPMVHLLPHWTWPGREGQPIPVMAYTNAEQVELFLDGVSLGRKTRGRDPVRIPVGASVNDGGVFDSPYRVAWDVPYRAGTLRAVAYRGGREVARTEVRTASAARTPVDRGRSHHPRRRWTRPRLPHRPGRGRVRRVLPPRRHADPLHRERRRHDCRGGQRRPGDHGAVPGRPPERVQRPRPARGPRGAGRRADRGHGRGRRPGAGHGADSGGMSRNVAEKGGKGHCPGGAPGGRVHVILGSPAGQ